MGHRHSELGFSLQVTLKTRVLSPSLLLPLIRRESLVLARWSKEQKVLSDTFPVFGWGSSCIFHPLAKGHCCPWEGMKSHPPHPNSATAKQTKRKRSHKKFHGFFHGAGS